MRRARHKGERIIAYRAILEGLTERDYLGNLDVDGRIKLK
jgi:hypothetical protein